MRPTFSGFNVAKLGLDAARANLQITGQNMTNANSIGYTRQRVDLYAIGSGSHSMRYGGKGDSTIGNGVQIKGISQYRDPYLDVRYRAEHAKAGDCVTQFDALTDLSYIFGSTTEKGFDTAFSDFVSQLQQLSQRPSDPVIGKLVRSQASTLLQIFNETSTRIDSAQQRQLNDLSEKAIGEVNNALSNIARLNEEIKSANVSGNPALELLDERNLLLDNLSEYVNIETVQTPVEMGGGIYVEELSINLLGPRGEKFTLLDNGSYNQLGLVKGADGKPEIPVKIQLLDQKGTPIDSSNSGGISLTNGVINDCLTTGALKGSIKMINSSGEYGEPPTTDRGIPYYTKMLDTLASKFASILNEANGPDKPLFAAKDGGTAITAGNISIAEGWEKSAGDYITNTKKEPIPGVDNSSENDNILHMISLFTEKNKYTTDGTDTGYPLFTGSFQEFVMHTVTTHGIELQNVQRQCDTYTSNLDYVDTQRQSLSAVNVDEEGINLIMFNQALTAASRYMTTLDEALETIISKMGVVGR